MRPLICLLALTGWSGLMATGVYAQRPDPRLHHDPEVNLPAAQVPTRGIPAQGVGVTSGDTITVVLKNPRDRTQRVTGRPVVVRLYGVAAAPAGSAADIRAQNFIRRLILHRPVMLYSKSLATRGQIQAWAFSSSICINRELILNGYARWDRAAAPGEKKLGDFEKDARLNHRGIWRVGRR